MKNSAVAVILVVVVCVSLFAAAAYAFDFSDLYPWNWFDHDHHHKKIHTTTTTTTIPPTTTTTIPTTTTCCTTTTTTTMPTTTTIPCTTTTIPTTTTCCAPTTIPYTTTTMSYDCHDGDNGKDFYTRSTTWKGGESRTDFCYSSGTVVEYFCNGAGNIISEYYNCPNGCGDNGRCLPYQTTTTYTTTTVSDDCEDDDGGRDYYNFGTVYTDNDDFDDYCYSSGTLVEYYCDGGNVRSVYYNCPNGCDDRECNDYGTTTIYHTTTTIRYYTTTTASSQCYDSDAGKNFFVKAFVSKGSAAMDDYCSTSGTLVEYYCDASGNAQTEYNNCQYGCDNGACKASAATTIQTTSIITTSSTIANQTAGAAAPMDYTALFVAVGMIAAIVLGVIVFFVSPEIFAVWAVISALIAIFGMWMISSGMLVFWEGVWNWVAIIFGVWILLMIGYWLVADIDRSEERRGPSPPFWDEV